MLNKIRKISNSLFIKLLLTIIVIAFIAFGISDVLNGRRNSDIVVFENEKSITKYDFLKAKSQEIRDINRQNNINLTDEQAAEIGIDNFVIQKLVNDAMLNHLISYYDLNLSEKTVINFIKQDGIFNNANGKFDKNILRSVLNNNNQSEDEYLKSVKSAILKDVLMNIFSNSFYVSKLMVDNISNYNNEKRLVDIISIDLKTNEFLNTMLTPTKEVLKDFYKQNQNLFTSEEKRDLSYIFIDNKFINNKVMVSDNEIQEYYDNNNDEFKEFNRNSKLEIKKILEQQKADELRIELIKNLEDDVASGSTLDEISEKYGIKLETLLQITYNDLKENKILSSIIDNIFNTNVNELFYPIENEHGIILFQLKMITQSTVLEFNDIENKVKELWIKQQINNNNVNVIDKIAKHYQDTKNLNFDINNINIKKSKSINLKSNISIKRDNTKFSKDLVTEIFNTPENNVTNIIQDSEHAIFAYIKSIENSNEDINKNDASSIDISNKIKQGIMLELIQYLIEQNKAKVYYDNIK